MIWKTIEKMIKYCQWMTTNKTKYFICMEIIKMKATQIKYQLLQPYMDHASIVNYVWLWKQIVAFFVCIQKKKNKKLKHQLNKKKKMHLEKK